MPLGTVAVGVAVLVFVAGVVLVIESVEVFVEAVAESEVALGVSGFFLTVLLAGTDLENAVLGLAAVFDRLPRLALGTVFGEALFIFGAALGITGVVAPFETRVPRPYLVVMLVTPGLMLALSVDGTLSRLDGAVLTGAYVPLLGVVYALESRASTRYLAAEDPTDVIEEEPFELDLFDAELPRIEAFVAHHEGLFRLGLALAAVVGMTVGSELAVSGARDLLVAFGVTGLAFGATVMSFIASLEELFLTLRPVQQDRPHIGVGNVVGSTVFFVTANAGVIALVRPIDTGGVVFTVHWPFFAGLLVAVTAVFARGRVGRPTGIVLLAGYVAYWGANYLP